jgi:hypothetical protein
MAGPPKAVVPNRKKARNKRDKVGAGVLTGTGSFMKGITFFIVLPQPCTLRQKHTWGSIHCNDPAVLKIAD